MDTATLMAILSRLDRLATAMERIAVALETANAADPVQEIVAALGGEPVNGVPRAPHHGLMRGEPDLPPQEHWRLR